MGDVEKKINNSTSDQRGDNWRILEAIELTARRF